MINIAFKNLMARRARSFLCVLAVMVSVFLNGSTATMNTWMYESVTAELARSMGKIYVQQGGSGYPPFDSTIPQEVADDIMGRPDLGLNSAESTPLIFIRMERGMMPFMAAEAMVIGVPVGKEDVLMGDVQAVVGTNRLPGEADDVTILGESAAEYYSGTIDQDVTINGQRLRVIGVLARSSMDSVNMSAIVSMSTAQRIFAREGTVSTVVLTASSVGEVGQMATTLRQEYPLLEVTTQEDMLAEAETLLEMPMFYMGTMSLTAFIVAVVVIMSTMVMAVMERTREIGTLRALGASQRLILGTVLVEILTLSLIGGIPGTLLSIPMAIMMETTLPAPAALVQILVGAISAGIVGGLYPGWRASRVVPLEALRYE